MSDFVSQQKHDADIELLTLAISDTRERIEDYKDSTNRQISFWGLTIAAIALLFAGMQIGIAVVLYIMSQTPAG